MRIVKLLRTLATSFVAAAALLVPGAAHAAAVPSLYFENSSLNAANESNFSLPLRLNGNGTTVNTVNVVVTYPVEQLTFVGLDKTGAYFDTVVPASPRANDGKVAFGVASFGRSTNSDVLVSRLVFTAKGTSGTAKISLAGSETANGGEPISTNISGTTIQLLASGDAQASTLAITKTSVTDITTSNGTVRWHTDVPSSSSVDYGNTNTYGFTASADGLTTDHVVRLGEIFSGKTTVHFKVSSVSADSKNGFSTDDTFITQGYTVDVLIKDKNDKPISNARVYIGDSKAVKTNSRGVATITDVTGGNQKVFIDNTAPQIITVKEVNGKAGVAHQQFSLVAERSSTLGSTTLLALLFVILACVLYWAWRRRDIRPQV